MKQVLIEYVGIYFLIFLSPVFFFLYGPPAEQREGRENSNDILESSVWFWFRVTVPGGDVELR